MSSPERAERWLPRRPADLPLPAAMKSVAPPDNVIRVGRVAAVLGRNVYVSVGGGIIRAGYLTSYAPRVDDAVAVVRQDASWLILGGVVGVGGGSGSVGMGQLAGKVFAQTSTLASSTGTTTQVSKYLISFVQPAGRTVLVRARFSWSSTNSADWLLANLRLGTTAGSTAVGEYTEPVGNSSFGRVCLIEGVVAAPSAMTTRVVTLWVSRLAGAGTLSVQEYAIRPGYMVAWDIGDSTSLPVI